MEILALDILLLYVVDGYFTCKYIWLTKINQLLLIKIIAHKKILKTDAMWWFTYRWQTVYIQF